MKGTAKNQFYLEKPKLVLKCKLKMISCGQYFSLIYSKNGDLMVKNETIK